MLFRNFDLFPNCSALQPRKAYSSHADFSEQRCQTFMFQVSISNQSQRYASRNWSCGANVYPIIDCVSNIFEAASFSDSDVDLDVIIRKSLYSVFNTEWEPKPDISLDKQNFHFDIILKERVFPKMF